MRLCCSKIFKCLVLVIWGLNFSNGLFRDPEHFAGQHLFSNWVCLNHYLCRIRWLLQGCLSPSFGLGLAGDFVYFIGSWLSWQYFLHYFAFSMPSMLWKNSFKSVAKTEKVLRTSKFQKNQGHFEMAIVLHLAKSRLEMQLSLHLLL